MKSADFFLSKATEYINAFDAILQNFHSRYSQGFDITPEYKEQEEKVSDLKLKTKLLFAEFDNGELFRDRAVSIDENRLLWLKEEGGSLKQYKHVLTLFVDHINEFRK